MVVVACVLAVIVYVAGTVALGAYLRPTASGDDGKEEPAYHPFHAISDKYRRAAVTGGTSNCTEIAT